MEKIGEVFLRGQDGPTGAFAFVSANVKGIYYASKGDGANAAGAAAGLWGGLSGSVIGFLVGGPIGAIVGGMAGGTAAGAGAKAIVEANLPKHLDPDVKKDLVKVCIDTKVLGKYRRQPSIRPEIDHSSFIVRHVDGHDLLFWQYEDHVYPASLSTEQLNVAIISHFVSGVHCLSQFSMNASGDIDEFNPQKNERWLWKRQ